MLGLNMKIREVVDAIKGGESPVLSLYSGVYVFSIKDDVLGTFVFTKFVDNVAQYTVRIPYSYKNTLEELIANGETLHHKRAPELVEIPT